MSIFSEMLNSKIAKLRNKEKKSELTNFERIASGNFKKKVEKTEKVEETPYLTVEDKQKRPNIKSREKNRMASKSPMGKDDSSENKLKRLFSKDKKTVKEK